MDNWDPESVFVDGRYQSTDTWYDADDKPFQPQVHYFVGGATKLYGAALVPACGRRTSASCTTSTACRRPGRSTTTTSSPGTPRPSGSTRCTATPARTRPRATAPSPTRGRRCRTSRGSNSSSTTWPKGGYHPFHAPVRRPPRRGATGPAAPASAAPGATAIRASCTPRPTPRPSRCDRSSTCPTSRCSSTPRSSGSTPTTRVAP